jgi:hypothetical protein
VKALLRRRGEGAEESDGNLVERLAAKFRLRAFIFDRPDGVRALELSSPSSAEIDPEPLAEQLTTAGQVTALGAALSDLSRRHATGNLAALLIWSDFDHNAGPPPLAAARALGAPIYTVGVGPLAAVDLAVDLQAPLLAKKGERSTAVVTLRQSGLEGRSVGLTVEARRLDREGAAGAGVVTVAQREVELEGGATEVELPYTPEETGGYILVARVARQEGEVVEQNNTAERRLSVRDDFLRLLFVEYEPTWEWRFIKEVFHRDQLVGMRGFRTFLRSADPRVRQTNELFLATMSPRRSEFFATDVVFLGDLPASALSGRFCELTREFVGKFGGGLVVLSGPRFGPGQLSDTPFADMLPVVVDREARLRDRREFALELTPEAAHFDFMRLGASEAENAVAWGNLAGLPWYQPAAHLHPLATALAVHPEDTCADGTTSQPLIAIRRFGKGEVVYLAFNETWRLRRKYGERYYRQFWGQMIHRLALSHALGTQKRFVVRTDRQRYQVDDRVLLTVEAYNEDFEPLAAEKLAERRLEGELVLPEATGSGSVRPISLPELRDGIFETRVPVFTSGEHRVRVKDPVSGEFAAVSFEVTALSAERRAAVRNAALERELARATGGKTYDLETVGRFPDEVELPERSATTVRILTLWNTRLCFVAFGLAVALMLGEWLARKLVNLR